MNKSLGRQERYFKKENVYLIDFVLINYKYTVFWNSIFSLFAFYACNLHMKLKKKLSIRVKQNDPVFKNSFNKLFTHASVLKMILLQFFV